GIAFSRVRFSGCGQGQSRATRGVDLTEMALALSIPTGQAGVGSRFVSERADGEADACAAPAELPDVLRAAAGGDEEAWRIIVRLYGRRVFALVQSRCRQADLPAEIRESVSATAAAQLREGAIHGSGAC